MRSNKLAALIILGSAIILPAYAGGTRSDSEVKVTAAATKLDASGKQTLTVTLVHNKGWHTYANPVGNDDFDGNKVVVKVNAKVKPADVKITYPTGKVHKDKTVGDYKIYEDKVEIKAAIQRAAGDTSPLEVAVTVLACHDKGKCLLPATVKLTVP